MYMLPAKPPGKPRATMACSSTRNHRGVNHAGPAAKFQSASYLPQVNSGFRRRLTSKALATPTRYEEGNSRTTPRPEEGHRGWAPTAPVVGAVRPHVPYHCAPATLGSHPHTRTLRVELVIVAKSVGYTPVVSTMPMPDRGAVTCACTGTGSGPQGPPKHTTQITSVGPHVRLTTSCLIMRVCARVIKLPCVSMYYTPCPVHVRAWPRGGGVLRPTPNCTFNCTALDSTALHWGSKESAVSLGLHIENGRGGGGGGWVAARDKAGWG
jgi:hypothetical protein